MSGNQFLSYLLNTYCNICPQRPPENTNVTARYSALVNYFMPSYWCDHCVASKKKQTADSYSSTSSSTCVSSAVAAAPLPWTLWWLLMLWGPNRKVAKVEERGEQLPVYAHSRGGGKGREDSKPGWRRMTKDCGCGGTDKQGGFWTQSVFSALRSWPHWGVSALPHVGVDVTTGESGKLRICDIFGLV